MRIPVTLGDLTRSLAQGCETHGHACKHEQMQIVARCHPASATFTLFVPAIAGVRVVCATCHTVIVEIAVAGELEIGKGN